MTLDNRRLFFNSVSPLCQSLPPSTHTTHTPARLSAVCGLDLALVEFRVGRDGGGGQFAVQCQRALRHGECAFQSGGDQGMLNP